MKAQANIKTLLTLISFLQKKGCTISASGVMSMPHKVTKKSLTIAPEETAFKNALKLTRWLKQHKLDVSKGQLGIDKVVTISTREGVDVCKLKELKDCWAFRPTRNYVKNKAKPISRRIVLRRHKQVTAAKRVYH